MDRTRQKRLAVAVFALVAVILVGVGGAAIFDVDQGADSPPKPPASGDQMGQKEVIDLPVSSVFIVVTVIVLIGFIGLVTQFARDPWDSFVTLVEGVVASALIIGFWVALGQYFQSRGSSPPGGDVARPPAQTATPVGTETGFGEGASDPLAFPVDSTMFVAIALAVITVLTFLAWRFDLLSSSDAAGGESEEPAVEESLEEVGRVAGDAADEVESAASAEAADNVIYNAWKEMVELLGVSDPQSDTPRQFERAAIDAGMDADDVSLLTRTFEEVRYGDETVSDQRREEVTEVFRRIEQSFGEEPTDDVDTELEETQ